MLDLGLAPSDDNDAHISIRRSSERPTTDEDYLAYYSYDNRALYCYLAAFTPGVLDQIPDSAKKPLRRAASASAGSTDTTEMIDPDGGLLDRPGPRAFDVLGIYDAWGRSTVRIDEVRSFVVRIIRAISVAISQWCF